MLDRLLQWDRDSLIYLNNLGSENFDGFWVLVTNISVWIPLYLLFGYLVSRNQPKKEAIYRVMSLIALVVLVLLLTHFTKESVARLRPNNSDISGLIRVLKDPSSYSFFSGHAATSFSLTTLLVLFLRKRMRFIFLFFLWPLLFAYSRIYVGVHYPLDILVGALFGVSMAFIGFAIYKRFRAPYSN